MSGSVSDADYRPLQGALIVAQHATTKEQYQTASREDGQFELSIPFGEYKVTISLKGYITVTGICHARKEEGCFIEFGKRMQKTPN